MLPQRTSRVATQAGSSRFRFQPVPVPAAGTDAAVQPVRFLPGSVPPVPVRFRRFLSIYDACTWELAAEVGEAAATTPEEL